MKKIVLVIALAVGLIFVGSQAAEASQSQQPASVVHHSPVLHHHHAAHKISTGGCGFLRECIYFGQTETDYLGDMSITAIAGIICWISAGAACVVGGALAVGLVKYVDSHGYCPNSRPRLRIDIFPDPGGNAQCVGY